MNATNEKVVGGNLTTIAEYSDTAAGLAELRQRHQGVVYDVTVAKEMKAAKEARAELRTLRTELEKRRKEIKEPALERCRLIDAEAKQLTAQIVALEEPIDVQIKAEEARVEAEKLAKLEAERQRIEGIAKAIEEIRNVPGSLIGKPAVIVDGQLSKLRAQTLDPEFYAERYREAEDALAATISRVEQQLAAQREQEAEQRRITEERAELERMRAENERLRLEAEARAAAERAEAERKAQEERDRIAAEQRAKEEAERTERQRQEAEARATREAQERAEREAREAELAAERERQAAEQRRLDEERARLERERQEAAEKAEAERIKNLSLAEAARAVVSYYCRQGAPEPPKCVYDLAAILERQGELPHQARAKSSAAA